MSLDDTHRLVQAVLINGQMTIKYDGAKEWITADVLDAAVAANHVTGSYNGYVRYLVDGNDHAEQQTFYTLWMQGWTSVEYRNLLIKSAKQKSRKVPSRAKVVAKITAAATAWASNGADMPMKKVYRKDGAALSKIANCVHANQLKLAAQKANRLDTIVRNQLPQSFFDLLAKHNIDV